MKRNKRVVRRAKSSKQIGREHREIVNAAVLRTTRTVRRTAKSAFSYLSSFVRG